MSAPERVVIIDPAFLGDVVFDGPLVRALKRRSAEAYVGIVVRPPADAIARAIRGIDRVHVFDKRGKDRGLSGIERMSRELGEEQYHTALIPHPSIRSVLVAVRAKIPLRIGSGQGFWASRLLTERRTMAPGGTFVQDRLRLVDDDGDAGLEGTLVARAPIRGKARRIGLVLGSEWATKRWSIDQAADLLARLDPLRECVVFLGAEKERPLYEALRAKLGSTPAPPIEDAVGEPLDRLIDRLAGLDALIAGDTGPLHIARALGVPTIALFGPTPESRHRFTPADQVLAVELDCRPCSRHGSNTCPEGHHRCMKDLAADRVLDAVRRGEANRRS
jgi:ADP-heptose:LPS heptosyltransferase